LCIFANKAQEAGGRRAIANIHKYFRSWMRHAEKRLAMTDFQDDSISCHLILRDLLQNAPKPGKLFVTFLTGLSGSGKKYVAQAHKGLWFEGRRGQEARSAEDRMSVPENHKPLCA
jgi:hypothetical protein